MEAIRNYVEALFATLPQDADTLRIKADMLGNLEEKYNALLEEGKNEAEATGLVIASIGSAEELREEFGLANEAVPEAPARYSHAARPFLPALSRQNWLVIGLVYLVWAAAMIAVTYIVGEMAFNERFLPCYNRTTFVMLVCIAAGVRIGYALCMRYQIPIRLYALTAIVSLPVTLCGYYYLGHYWGLWGATWPYFPAVFLLLIGAAWLERSQTQRADTCEAFRQQA